MPITITEDFNNALGKFEYYDTDVVSYEALTQRKHTDIRSFWNVNFTTLYNLFNLNLDISQLNLMDMGAIEGSQTILPREPWVTTGILGSSAALGNRNALTFSFSSAGTKTGVSADTPVDLTSYASTDTITVSLPSCPAALDRANSYVELSDANSNIVRLYFTNVTTGTGNREATWPISALNGVLRPTIVKFSITATAACTVRISAFRAFAAGWTPTKLDLDTRRGFLTPILDKDGSVPATAFPKIWRSDASPGPGDPRPINSSLSVVFCTGSFASSNTLTLYLRGRREDFITQLDLDGTDPGVLPAYGENQASLAARGHQPDYGQAAYNPVPQSALEGLLQSDLSYEPPTDTTPARSQAEIERTPDFVSESWIEVKLNFGTTNSLVIGTTETLTDSDRYTYTIDTGTVPFYPNNHYVLNVDLEDNKLQARIHPMTLQQAGPASPMNPTPIFDTHVVLDDFKFKRRRGRVGWGFSFGDGDAYVDSIRTRKLMFGEIQTNNFESLTPVVGARLFAGGTADKTLPTGVFNYQNSVITVDKYNAQS
ncbi:MAG: hypothetical protein JWR61_5854, partial [Ferruginibacter sp.]|uniref:hypothetical protein n=1 Tax=Ferruginibacter sp. TaxID=1940288 RepID=UPI002658762A